jgi:hypothetical protein
VYLTARSYLLAGFTAASIVATIPFAPRTTVHMPDVHSADVRLAAAESQIAATVRTLRAVEARAVASTAEGTTTTVLPARQASTAATAAIVPVSVVGPVIGNGVALAFDLAGTQAALMNSVSFVADATIAALTGATAEDLPPGFGVPQRLNVITADLSNLAGAINHLTGFLQSGAAATGAPQTGVKTGSVAASNAGTGAAGLLPLIGDVAILGVDMTAAPFNTTQTVTRALAAASTDLGAGDLRAAQMDFPAILQAGLTESQTRIAKDQNNIGAALARLVGRPSTTTSQTDAASSVAGASSAVAATKTTSTPAVQSHPINKGPGPVVTKPRSSAPASTATGGSSTASHQGWSRTHGVTAKPTQQRGNTTGTTKSATQSPTKAGDSADGAGTAKHSAPAKPHKDGAKHRKH